MERERERERERGEAKRERQKSNPIELPSCSVLLPEMKAELDPLRARASDEFAFTAACSTEGGDGKV